MKISAVIIARDEEAKIAEAIASLSFADEVLVVDSGSSDSTVRIAEESGARVIVQPWLGFSKQKQYATDSARHDWILSLDADERISPELASQIGELVKTGTGQNVAFSIPRLSFYLGRPIRHCGWYPDRQVRLFDRRKCRWNDREIHESVQVSGALGELSEDIHHHSVDGPSHHHQMIGDRYAPMSALQSFKEGKRAGLAHVILSPIATFLRNYVFKAGFADGLPGFAICWFSAHHAFLKNMILWELSTGAKQPKDILPASEDSRI